MTARRVLDIGQCDYDHGNISGLLRKQFSAEVVRAHTSTEALGSLRRESFDLVLVNRIFDRNGESGLDLIRHVKAEEKTKAVPVMLVSNFPEAQTEAIAAGAVPGFGKATLTEPTTKEQLQKYLGA